MRLCILIFLIFISLSGFAKETLMDKPIDLTPDNNCKINEFCEKNIEEIDIEKYIKQEIKNDYVVVSLDECLMVALKNNFNIQITEHDFLSSKYEYENRLSKFLPFLNTTSYISDYQGQILVGGILRDQFHETALSFNITAQHDLTQGGKQIFEAKAAKYFEKSKKHNLYFTKSQVLYYCAKYYYEMLLAKINIEIYLRNYIERNAQLVLSQNLKNSGFGTNFDVIRAKSESLAAKISLIRALNDFRLSQSRLANIMGIKTQTGLMPFEDETSPMQLLDETTPLEEMFEMAINFREDLKSYKNLISYEKQIKNVYKTEFMPKPLISYQEQWQGTLGSSIRPNYILTAHMTWDLGEGLGVGTITKIKKQNEIIKVKELEMQNKLREIQEEIINSQSSSKFNKAEIEISKKRLDYAQESVKLAMLRFDNGKGILLDVIQAQSQVTFARAQYVSAVINYNLSQLNLVYNCGTITLIDIIKNYKP